MEKTVARGVYGYVRVSTDGQGLSATAQEERIRAQAIVRGCELTEIITDVDESGKSLRRSGIQFLRDMVKARRVEAIIVCKLDRLTRSVSDLNQLMKETEKGDAALISLSESLDTKSATGRFIVTIIGAISEWERGTISERTKTILRHKQTKGERTGNVPFGFTAGLNERGTDGKTIRAAKLVPDPREQSIIARVRELRSEGVSLQKICNQLEEEGLKTRGGGVWKPPYVLNLLRKI